ncbi:MAG TPA: hypothetical protein VMN38_10300 [Sphingomicrobium sp.]|nr:hypothetical protein [Sphingomicrobium sp.]
MKLAKVLAVAAPIALLGSQASAENWVKILNDEYFGEFVIDRDSIRRGSDGLVYYSSDGDSREAAAADCRGRIKYTLKLYDMRGEPMEFSDWRQNGRPVVANSVGEALFKYACANAE